MNGWQSIGSVVQYYIDNNILTPIEFTILVLLTRESFGRIENYIQIGIKDICLRTNSSKPTVIRAIKSMIDKNVITRIENQTLGSRTNYMYSVVFKKEINGINLKNSADNIKKRAEASMAKDTWSSV